jgi:type IV pilus assembly protein PilQ
MAPMNMNRHVLTSLAVVALLAAPAHAAIGTRTAPRAATTTIHFHNIPVRSALQVIAEEGHFNLVVSDSVQGTISLRLRDVTWEEALEVVLRMKGLQQRVDSYTRSVSAPGG